MKLEYLDDITDNGKFPWADPDRLIRLYDFDQREAQQLIDILQSTLVNNKEALDFSNIGFIESINCKLRFEIAQTDSGIGILTLKNDFVCRLTTQAYRQMIGYMEAFSKGDGSLDGYNWLYDPPENKIDLLFSPGGTW